MKILHSADWHLGKSFNNYNLLDEQKYILEQLVEIAIQEKPDLMILAGDIYDRSVPPAEAVRLFDEIMSALILDLKIPVLAIAGNHDNPERINYCNYLLKKQGLHIFGRVEIPPVPVKMEDAFGPIYFYPIPYTEPEILRYLSQENHIKSHEQVMQYLVAKIKEQHPPEARAVLVGHAFVAGGKESDSERQLLVGGAAHISAATFDFFDYVALGHLHGAQAFSDGRVQYSGSPLKYSFSEAHHHKSLLILELKEKGNLTFQTHALHPKKDVRRVKGKIEERQFYLEGDTKQVGEEDFLEVSLLNDEIVPNAMQIVQKTFPNTLSLKWPNLQRVKAASQLSTENLHKMSENELFEDFYKRFVGKELDPKKQEVLQKVIKSVKEDAD